MCTLMCGCVVLYFRKKVSIAMFTDVKFALPTLWAKLAAPQYFYDIRLDPHV